MEKLDKQPIGKTARRAYWYAVGRRKTAIARVRIWKKETGDIEVNGKTLAQYFVPLGQQDIVRSPLQTVGLLGKYRITVRVVGGGKMSQAGSIRHGISRALLLCDPDYRSSLKSVGYLTRDPRGKERKKFGLKRARRAPQWSKR